MNKLKHLYHKLVDKIFGKRCKCDVKVKDAIDENKNIFQSKIEFKNLTFSYDLNSNKKDNVLENINFDIKWDDIFIEFAFIHIFF